MLKSSVKINHEVIKIYKIHTLILHYAPFGQQFSKSEILIEISSTLILEERPL